MTTTITEVTAELLERGSVYHANEEQVTEKLLQAVLSRADESIDVATAIDQGIENAIDACNEADYDVLVEQVADAVHAAIAAKAEWIAMDAISRMAATAGA